MAPLVFGSPSNVFLQAENTRQRTAMPHQQGTPPPVFTFGSGGATPEATPLHDGRQSFAFAPGTSSTVQAGSGSFFFPREWPASNPSTTSLPFRTLSSVSPQPTVQPTPQASPQQQSRATSLSPQQSVLNQPSPTSVQSQSPLFSFVTAPTSPAVSAVTAASRPIIAASGRSRVRTAASPIAVPPVTVTSPPAASIFDLPATPPPVPTSTPSPRLVQTVHQLPAEPAVRPATVTPWWPVAPVLANLPELASVPAPPRPPPAPRPYNPSEEAAPPRPFYLPAVQDALRHGKKIAQEAAAAIRSLNIGPESDANVERLLTEAEGLQNFQSRNTRIIAVLGNTGDGKSSLINSLLHVPGLAPESGSGRACTSIVTEYHQKQPDQEAPFLVEVEYLDTNQMKEHLRELLWNYRRIYRPDINFETLGDAEYKQLEAASNTAWSTLHTAFRHERGFSAAFVQNMAEGSDESILDQLLTWADLIAWPHGSDPGFWTTTALTVDACSDATRPFMEDQFWPFTKMIRIFLSSHVLNSGIILADLPGLQDVNLARVRATQEYIIRCDSILVVGRIARAISDHSLQSSLYMSLASHVPAEWQDHGAARFNIAVACTHAEDINMRVARHELRDAETMAELDRLDGEINAARARGDLRAELNKKLEQQRLLVGERNRIVTRGLQDAYGEKMNNQDRQLPVFCLSNKWYDEFTAVGDTDLVVASQIPALRQYCQTITADAQLDEAKHYLRSKLPALLTSLELWVTSTIAAQNQQSRAPSSGANTVMNRVRLLVRRLGTEVPSPAGVFGQQFRNCFQEQIMTYFSDRGEVWRQQAVTESEKWTISTIGPGYWHQSQYNSWCLHDGNYSTKKKPNVNWNAKLIWRMRMELDLQWEIVEEQAHNEFKAIHQSASTRLGELTSRILEANTVAGRDGLVRLIGFNLDELKHSLDQEERRFLVELKARRSKTSEATCASYIVEQMLPAYRDAACQSGNGRRSSQQTIIDRKVRSGDIFLNLGNALVQDIYAVVAKTEIAIKSSLDTMCHNIRQNVTLTFGEQAPLPAAVPAPRRDAALERRLQDFLTTVSVSKARHTLLFVRDDGGLDSLL